MTETKKSNTIKKEDIELKDIENAIGGNVEEHIKEVEPEKSKEIVDKALKNTEKTFADKSAEAAANAALKAAIDANNEIAIKESEKAYFIEKKNFMLNKCKNDEIVERTISKLYAPIIGRVYTFALNGIPVTVYCDGKPHKYPKFIAEIIDRKINEISESNTYKEVIDERLDQGTY